MVQTIFLFASSKCRVLAYVLLLVVDGEFQAVEPHLLALFRLERIVRVVVEHHLELLRRSGVVQQVHRELLHLPSQFLEMIEVQKITPFGSPSVA